MTDRLPDFRLYLWPSKALYVGRSPENDLHRHHAAQVCVSLAEPFRFRTSEKSSWTLSQAVQIPSECVHQVASGDTPLLVLYVEPESEEYLSFKTGIEHGTPFIEVPTNASLEFGISIQHLIRRGERPDLLWSAVLELLGLEAPPVVTRVGDRRVQAAVDIIRSEVGRSLRVDALARRVELSPSRLSHLFKQQTGVPIRRYVMWTRLRAAVAYSVAGCSLTQLAHAVGFSDGAHLSRTFRQMFGFPPSALFPASETESVILVDH